MTVHSFLKFLPSVTYINSEIVPKFLLFLFPRFDKCVQRSLI